MFIGALPEFPGRLSSGGSAFSPAENPRQYRVGEYVGDREDGGGPGHGADHVSIYWSALIVAGVSRSARRMPHPLGLLTPA